MTKLLWKGFIIGMCELKSPLLKSWTKYLFELLWEEFIVFSFLFDYYVLIYV